MVLVSRTPRQMQITECDPEAAANARSALATQWPAALDALLHNAGVLAAVETATGASEGDLSSGLQVTRERLHARAQLRLRRSAAAQSAAHTSHRGVEKFLDGAGAALGRLSAKRCTQLAKAIGAKGQKKARGAGRVADIRGRVEKRVAKVSRSGKRKERAAVLRELELIVRERREEEEALAGLRRAARGPGGEAFDEGSE